MAHEELFDAFVRFLESVGGVDLSITDGMILSDVSYVARRWGGFEALFVAEVPSLSQRVLILKRAKREVLRRYFQDFVDEIAEQRQELDELDDEEERADNLRCLRENLANYLPEFPGRPPWPPENAWLMSRSFFGAPLSPFDVRHWTRQLLAAAGLADQPVVYFVSFDDPSIVKIGWAGNLRRRIRTFRITTVAEPTVHLAIPGNAVVERDLHRRFGGDRIRGELFRLSPAIADFIAERKREG